MTLFFIPFNQLFELRSTQRTECYICSDMLFSEIVEKLHDRGMTIFMNTHLLSEVARSCTSIGVLAHGRLVFHDSMQAVTDKYDERSLEDLYVGVAERAPQVAA